MWSKKFCLFVICVICEIALFCYYSLGDFTDLNGSVDEPDVKIV